MAPILTETRGRVGLVTLNRPEALNALNAALIAELVDAVDAFDADDGVGAIVITGSERAFAAGADIKEMAALTFAEAYASDHGDDDSTRVERARKPLDRRRRRHCLGGGASSR